ncbi:MAG: Coenzyme F420 hydrogenase/dehydrogenase, beta subunit C-terminal domain [Candidatus Hydrogenedentes bacterium]|nr:Coenzyme F420 hydrogenase/dehydrogenase, beta subunit C-terminal domain [Candidatus Hydrogenedentota bacterium]
MNSEDTEKKLRISGYDLLKTHVLDTDMCCGCGGCVGICPVDALEIKPAESYAPVFYEDKCIKCPFCYEVCPGQGYAVAEMAEKNNQEYNEAPAAMDPVRGPELGHILGWATDETQRREGASGGIATALMLHCLETGIADEALVTVIRNEVPVPLLTSDPEVIKEARGSKYSPVPIMDIIDSVRRKPRKIVIIGSGCHLASWQLAEKRFKKLRDCVVLSMGFFCGGVQEIDALEALAASLGVKYPEEVEFMGLREGDFPGNARFRHRVTGEIYDKPLYPALDMAVPYYTLNRCHLCPDNSAWLADLVLGDHHDSKDNDTAVTIRTDRGRNILESARRMGRITFSEMTDREVKISTSTQILASKVYPSISRIDFLKKNGRPIPIFDFEHPEMFRCNPQFKRLRFLWVFKYRILSYLSSGWRFSVIKKFPWVMERFGHFLYYFPATIPGYMPLAKLRRKLLDMRSGQRAKTDS